MKPDSHEALVRQGLKTARRRIESPMILLHTFGILDPYLCDALKAPLRQRFHLPVKSGPSFPMPESAYSADRRQYRSTVLLAILGIFSESNPGIHLGITAADLFVPGLNFVFGESSEAERIAIVSTARLDPRFYQHPIDNSLFLRRLITETAHELGHTFGLRHCERPDCAMWFSNSLEETDRKGPDFCPVHQALVMRKAQAA